MMDLVSRVVFRFQTRSLYARLIKAMSVEEAKKILGFPPNSNPTAQEVSKAYRDMAFKNHPDRGGDPTTMVEINVAKDVLEGKGRSRSEPSATPYSPPKKNVRRVSFDEAKSKAGVPQADWKFKTQTAHGGFGDTQVAGFVVCGKLGDKLVFVAVESYSYRNAFTGEDFDEWWMKSVEVQGTFRDKAPQVIRQLFDQFPNLKKKYNAKVEILSDGAVLNEKLIYSSGRAMSFKDALDILGEIDQNDPWAQRKVTIEVRLSRRPGTTFGKYNVELVLNGRGYKLDEANANKLEMMLPKIFGTYYYDGSKKVLTRAKNGAQVIQWLIDHLQGEPSDLMSGLEAALNQITGKA